MSFEFSEKRELRFGPVSVALYLASLDKPLRSHIAFPTPEGPKPKQREPLSSSAVPRTRASPRARRPLLSPPRAPSSAMYSAGLEILGMILAVAGWLGVMVTCGMPMWRVAAYVGQNIVISQVIWEGLWMNCSVQSTGQMHCKVHDSMLGLPVDLQAARALVVVSLVMCVAGIGLSTAGAKCTNCSADAASKPRLVVTAGVTFLLAGTLLMVAVSWTANAIVVDFYDPTLEETGKREFGNALYFGWAASCLLVLGGALLCCSCPPRPPGAAGSGGGVKPHARAAATATNYSAVKTASVNGYTRRDYV
ncbi:unnamed protein product [Boreogadus saida]